LTGIIGLSGGKATTISPIWHRSGDPRRGSIRREPASRSGRCPAKLGAKPSNKTGTCWPTKQTIRNSDPRERLLRGRRRSVSNGGGRRAEAPCTTSPKCAGLSGVTSPPVFLRRQRVTSFPGATIWLGSRYGVQGTSSWVSPDSTVILSNCHSGWHKPFCRLPREWPRDPKASCFNSRSPNHRYGQVRSGPFRRASRDRGPCYLAGATSVSSSSSSDPHWAQINLPSSDM